jgi:hypothetical protein
MRIYRRIRAKLAALDTESEPIAEPESPPAREHLFGSQYRVRVPFADVVAQRYNGNLSRPIHDPAPGSADRRARDAIAPRAGFTDVLWPPE